MRIVRPDGCSVSPGAPVRARTRPRHPRRPPTAATPNSAEQLPPVQTGDTEFLPTPAKAPGDSQALGGSYPQYEARQCGHDQ